MSDGLTVEQRTSVAAIVAAILLPPLGVFLVHGLRPAFWVSVLLTLLGWLPGVVFSLVAVLSPAALGRLTA